MRPNVGMLRYAACGSCVLLVGLIATLFGAPPPGGGLTSSAPSGVVSSSAPSIALGSPSGVATGNGNTVRIAPNFSISAPGMLWSMAVYLVNHPDGDNEFLSLPNWNLNAVASSSPGYISGVVSFTGGASASDYQAIIQSMTYQDNNVNPMTGSRTIRVVVSDGTSSVSATTSVFVTGSTPISTNGSNTMGIIGAPAPVQVVNPPPVSVVSPNGTRTMALMVLRHRRRRRRRSSGRQGSPLSLEVASSPARLLTSQRQLLRGFNLL